MSNKPSPHQHTSSTTTTLIPDSWHQFIKQTLEPSTLTWSKFPKKQLLKFSQNPASPKIKQLTAILPEIYRKYARNCQYFRQLIILFYLLALKGCINTNQQLIDISLSVLQQLLNYRLIIVCSMLTTHSIIVQVYDYLEHWLNLLVPAILANSKSYLGKQKNWKKGKDKFKDKYQKNKSVISVLYAINRKQQQRFINTDNNNKIDQLLIIFQTLFVAKIRNHLTHSSLFQFDNIMRKLYPPQKYQLIYQGKGCISHIPNKQKQKKQQQKQLLQNNYISISGLIPSRLDQLHWQLYDLQLYLPQDQPKNQQSKQKKSSSPLSLKKIPCQSQPELPPWVIDAFKTNTKPHPIKITLKIMLNKMKTMEIYKFLYLLEIYGSSPNIQQLNQFIPDDTLLDFFTKYLLGQNLLLTLQELEPPSKQNITNNSSQHYNYKNQQLCSVLERCMNETLKLQAEIDRNLFIEEFKTKLMGAHTIKEKNQNDNNYEQRTKQ